jgi:hypothetical protein
VRVILLAVKYGSELPALAKFKNLLGTSDLKLYKSAGWFSRDVDKLLDAIGYSSSQLFPIDHLGPDRPYCSDLVLVKAGACSGSFLKIAYPELVVDGFDLTTKNFADLEIWLNQIDAAIDVNFSIETCCRELRQNIDTFNKLGVNDPSVIDFDISAFEQQKGTYGVQTIKNAQNEITKWLAQNRWK